MQCKKCGSLLQELDKFCRICGTPVDTNNQQNQNNQGIFINNQTDSNQFNDNLMYIIK